MITSVNIDYRCKQSDLERGRIMSKKKNIPRTISDAEAEILMLLWEESPLTAQQIIARLDGHPSTVKTLINRLLKKQALSFHEENRKYHYYPTVDKKDFYQVKTQSFLNRFFDGGVTPLVSFFTSQKKLSEKEITELKQLIEKMEAENEN